MQTSVDVGCIVGRIERKGGAEREVGSSVAAKPSRAREVEGAVDARAEPFPLTFADGASGESYPFRHRLPGDPYLTRLRSEYGLDGVVAGTSDDEGRLRMIRAWVHGRWQHDGWNEPERSDAISLLREAERGARFRCVEYSIVLAAALSALGIPARVLGLRTQDAETRESGAGHAVVEAWLPDRHTWVMADGQWDITPVAGGAPLNAVELRQALARDAAAVDIDTSASDAGRNDYLEWIAPYLCYFDVPLDNRCDALQPDPQGTERLMLVPVGAKEPRVFQRRWPLRGVTFTRSLQTFYAAPV